MEENKQSKYNNNREFLIKNVTGKKCTKCGKEIISIGYFNMADESGVTGMAIHSYVEVHGPFGSSTRANEKCFLTDAEFEIIINTIQVQKM